MRKTLAVVVGFLLLAGAAMAQFNGCPPGLCNTGAGGTLACSNMLDFSQSCNSQYLTVVK